MFLHGIRLVDASFLKCCCAECSFFLYWLRWNFLLWSRKDYNLPGFWWITKGKQQMQMTANNTLVYE